MATEKKKVLTIETSKSEKNVKSLKQQMKELREQMAQLTKGTDEYNKASKKLADLNQKQIEIGEAMKYSNRDIGATLNNLKNITVGVAAGFNGISASLQLLGIASDESGEALKNIQLMMAVIQSVGAIDTALKSLNGLANAFGFLKKSSNEVTDDLKKANEGIDSINIAKKNVGLSTQTATSAELSEASALTENTTAMKANNDEAGKYVSLNKQNAKATDESTASIKAEIDALKDKVKALQDAKKAMDEQNANNYAEAQNLAYSKALQYYKKTNKEYITDLKISLEDYNDMVSKGIRGEVFEDAKNNVITLTEKVNETADAYDRLATTGVSSLDDLRSASSMLNDDLIEYFQNNAELDLDDFETFSDILKGLPIDEATAKLNELENELSNIANDPWLQGDEDLTESAERMAEGFDEASSEIKKVRTELQDFAKKQAKLEADLKRTTKAIDEQNKALPKGSKLWKAFGNAGKAALKAIKTAFIATGIGGIIALITKGLMLLVDKIDWDGLKAKLNGISKEYEFLQSLDKGVSGSFYEQTTRLTLLKKTLEDNTETLADRKKALEEIKKVVPEYLGQLDEEGRLTNSNTEAIDNYINKLKEKLAYQAYEQKYIELLQEQLDVDQQLKKFEDATWWYKLWHSKNKLSKQHTQILEEQAIVLQRIKELNLDIALTEPVKKTGGGGGTTAQLKMWVDYLKEIRSLLQNIWGTYFDNLDLQIDFNNFNPTRAFKETINRILKTGSDVSGMFTEWFDNALKKGIKDIKASDLKLNGIFKKDDLQEYYDKVWEQIQVYEKLLKEGEERAKNNKNMTSAQTKQWEKEKKAYEDTLAKLKAESKAIIDITKATESYIKNQDELFNKTVELQKAEAEYRKGLKIEAQYRKEAREGNADADANRQIANAKMQLALTENLRITDEARYESLKQIKDKTKAQYEEEIELQKKVLENEKFVTEQEAIIEEANYTKRTNRMKQFYEEADRYAELFATRNANSKTAKGWGTADYNVNMDALIAQLNAMKQKMDELNEQQDMDAVEKANRMIELQQQTADLELQIETEKVNRKIAINQTYYNALSQMASGVQGILQAEMDKYDENSEQYRKLAVANAWIDTISGTLSAFMSGMQSGIPAPYNAVLATALAGMTFYAGQQQIRALESGTKGSAMNVQMPTTTYETLAYENQTELLGKIKDTKVYVTESDITSTQRKVAVRESNARF